MTDAARPIVSNHCPTCVLLRYLLLTLQENCQTEPWLKTWQLNSEIQPHSQQISMAFFHHFPVKIRYEMIRKDLDRVEIDLVQPSKNSNLTCRYLLGFEVFRYIPFSVSSKHSPSLRSLKGDWIAGAKLLRTALEISLKNVSINLRRS